MVLLPELPDLQAGDGEGMEGAPSAEQDDGGGGWDSEDSEDAGDGDGDEGDPELMDEESLRQVIREELQAAQNRLQRRLLLCIAVVALLRLLW